MYVLLSHGAGHGGETGSDCHAICKQSASYMVLCYKVMASIEQVYESHFKNNVLFLINKCEQVHMPRCTWIQRTTYETWFSHFIMWVLGIEVRLSSFTASDLTSKPPCSL